MFKKITFTLVIALATATFSLAQIESGKVLTGGGIRGIFTNDDVKTSSGTTSISKSRIIEVNPTIGAFVSDNIAVGAMINYIHQKYESENFGFGSISSTYNVFVGGPFIRVYDKSGFFGEASVGIGIGTDSEFGDTSNAYYWRAGVGYAIFLSETVALEPTLNYGITYSKDEQFDDVTYRNKSFTFGLNFSLYL